MPCVAVRMDSSKNSPVMAVSASNSVPVIGSSSFSASCAGSALALFPNLPLPLWRVNTADPVDLSHRHHPPSPPTSSAYTNYVASLPPGSSSMQAVPSHGQYSPPYSPPLHPTSYPGNWSPGSSGSRSPPLSYAPPLPPQWPPISFLDSTKFRPSTMSVDDARKHRSHPYLYHPYSSSMGSPSSSPWSHSHLQKFYASQVNSDSVKFPRLSCSSKPAVTKPLASTPAAAAVPTTVSPASSSQVRPFKAIAKDPLALVMNSTLLFDQHTQAEFMEFRAKSLAKIKRTGDNSKMSRSGSSSSSSNTGDNNNNSQSAEETSNNEGHNKTEERDATYLEKRKKNNEAAKKSRDARKMREDELAIWAEFMKLQNVRLMNRVAFLEDTLGQMQMTVQQQAQQLLQLQRRASPDRVRSSSSSSSSTPIAPVA